MAETTIPPLTVRFPRLARRGVILGLSGVQVGCIGAGLLLLVLAVFIAGVIGLVLVAPLVVALMAGAVVRVGGHPGVVWAARWLNRERRRAATQTRWRAKPARPAPEGSLGLPGTAASLARVHVPGWTRGGARRARSDAHRGGASLDASVRAARLRGADPPSGRLGAGAGGALPGRPSREGPGPGAHDPRLRRRTRTLVVGARPGPDPVGRGEPTSS